MGDGEEYLISFDDWLAARSPEARARYARDNPEPPDWQGFYARRGVDPA